MNKFKTLFSISVITLIFIFIFFLAYNLAEPKAYDFMTKHVLTKKLPFDKYKKVYGSDDILLVVIDAKTVEKYRWPWKREVNCKIFEYFAQYAKPKVVVHDSILVSLDKDNPNSDKRFFNTLSKFDNLVVGFMPSINPWENKNLGEKYDNNFAKYSIKVEDKTSPKPLLYESMMTFPNAYMNAVKHAGSVSMLPGAISGNISRYFMDEIYRNHEYFLKYNNGIYPSLALKTFLVAKNNPKMIITDKSLEFPDLKYKVNVAMQS